MLIQKISPEKLTENYNILCQSIYPARNGTGTDKAGAPVSMPFGSTWCVVQPNNITSRHHHHEGETFFIQAGQGLMTINDEQAAVGAGDVIYIPPFSDHTLRNTSSSENLTFLSVYWELSDRVWEAAPPQRVMIFSAPPTPNGRLHVGHLSGPYVAADVYRRFLALNDVDVRYVCGSDDHQSYVPVKGQALNLTPSEVIDRFTTSIKDTLARFDAAPDYFLKVYENPAYIRFVQDFFQRLLDHGKIELRDTDTLFCEKCNLFLYEAHVHGGCPGCGATTNGNGCEECGRTNDCINLRDPACNHCQQPASRKKVQKYYFPLGRYTEKLREYLAGTALAPRMRKFVMDLLDEGLPDVSVSHHSSWGIPVPETCPAAAGGKAPLSPGQVIYAWFEMAAGYLYIAQEISEGKGHAHQWSDARAQVVGAFGFDNSFFYLTFIPALLMAYDTDIRPPRAFLINQFFLLDGLKFSTSRNHAVWGEEILAAVPSDVLRFYLAYSRSELRQTNFTMQEFAETVHRELVLEWEPLLTDMDKLLIETLPPAPSEPIGRVRSFGVCLNDAVAEVTQAYTAAGFSLNEAARALSQLAQQTRCFLDTQLPLRGVRGCEAEWQGSLAFMATAVKALGILSYPIMPTFGAHVMKKFMLDPSVPHLWQSAARPLPGESPLHADKLSDGRFSAAWRAIEAFAAGEATHGAGRHG